MENLASEYTVLLLERAITLFTRNSNNEFQVLFAWLLFEVVFVIKVMTGILKSVNFF